jgi:hypothetical protein
MHGSTCFFIAPSGSGDNKIFIDKLPANDSFGPYPIVSQIKTFQAALQTYGPVSIMDRSSGTLSAFRLNLYRIFTPGPSIRGYRLGVFLDRLTGFSHLSGEKKDNKRGPQR